MKIYRYLFTFAILTFSVFSAEAQTENQPKYYRYFTVIVENISQAEFNQLSASRATSHLKFDDICSQKSIILVTYDASVPKRIDAMKAEIREALAAQFPEKEISKPKTLVYSDKSNFCK